MQNLWITTIVMQQRPRRQRRKSKSFGACFHGGGGPLVGEVIRSGSPHQECKRDQIKMRNYMDRRVTPPKRVTSPTWSPS